MKPIVSNDSTVYFGKESYSQLNAHLEKSKYSKVGILVDSNTHEYCLSRFMSTIDKEYDIEILEIEAGEIHKNIETCSGVWNALSELGFDRKSLLINLGGGVITDLGGFVASTYKRGIDYINVPTSLLAMVDASVGGKTGVDLGNLKNMVGVISESEMVLIDTEYLATLPVNQMCSGFSEMLKHGLIQDKEYWEKLSDLSQLELDDLDQLIYDSIVIKNTIVSKDPTEQNIRKYLNFGHTLGHAIESFYLTHPETPTLLHGEAIAIGMIMETYISSKLLAVTSEDLQFVSAVILATFPKVEIPAEDHEKIIALLVHDKKNERGNVLFVLLNTIGEAQYDCKVPHELLHKAFEYYNAL
ncbi:3-dehydroquinate synthase [Aquimarina sp. U1-2]|uniref:3-dehydroquinate synthase n=1 Tax=Aquimarina sp. U1-2 TaxID=2823141 RepID=UPI001AECC478|nr:3-dehydroquinate synthase [Aquimarina sp. U1-2]MBP2832655.1 3-dehydroquinate synthase [Aquimarina sp. U1-2]